MEKVKKSRLAMELRRKAGLSRTQVAMALGVVENTVARWERGEMVPHLPFNKVELLMKMYNCSIEELVEAFSQPASVENEENGLNYN